MTKNIVIIGAGPAAKLHYHTSKRVDGMQVIGVVGRDQKQTEAISGELEIGYRWASVNDVLLDDDVDGVVLAIPPFEIAKVAVAAFAARKHVLSEKPLGIGVDQAQQVAAAWEQSRCVGMINYCYRHHPLLRKFRQLIDERIFGDLNLLNIRWTLPTRLNTNLTDHWKGRRELGGGVLQNYGVHLLDYLFSGDPDVKCLSAVQRRVFKHRPNIEGKLVESTGDESTTVLIDWKEVPVQIHLSLVTKVGAGLQMRAEGTKGTFEFEELYRGKPEQSSRLTLIDGTEDEKILMEENGVALLPAFLFQESQKRFIDEISGIKNDDQQNIKQAVDVAKMIERIQNLAACA